MSLSLRQNLEVWAYFCVFCCFFINTSILEVLKSGFFTFPSLQILSNVLLATSSCDCFISFPCHSSLVFLCEILYSGILFLFKALSKSLTTVGLHPFLPCFEISAGTICAVFQDPERGGEPAARFSLCFTGTEIQTPAIIVLRRKS